jgi:hypothetical protein
VVLHFAPEASLLLTHIALDPCNASLTVYSRYQASRSSTGADLGKRPPRGLVRSLDWKLERHLRCGGALGDIFAQAGDVLSTLPAVVLLVTSPSRPVAHEALCPPSLVYVYNTTGAVQAAYAAAGVSDCHL